MTGDWGDIQGLFTIEYLHHHTFLLLDQHLFDICLEIQFNNLDINFEHCEDYNLPLAGSGITHHSSDTDLAKIGGARKDTESRLKRAIRILQTLATSDP